MTKIEKSIRKLLSKLYPDAVQLDIELLQLTHELEIVENNDDLSFLNIQSFHHSGIEKVTIRFRRTHDSHKD